MKCLKLSWGGAFIAYYIYNITVAHYWSVLWPTIAFIHKSVGLWLIVVSWAIMPNKQKAVFKLIMVEKNVHEILQLYQVSLHSKTYTLIWNHTPQEIHLYKMVINCIKFHCIQKLLHGNSYSQFSELFFILINPWTSSWKCFSLNWLKCYFKFTLTEHFQCITSFCYVLITV